MLATVRLRRVFGADLGAVGYSVTGGQRDFTSVTQVVATKYEVLTEHKHAARGRELLREMDPMAAAQAEAAARPGRRPARSAGRPRRLPTTDRASQNPV